ncbi:MAG: energy transducer TonB [Gammaproteobacteria bacterium HGW-Gammaproteobacteria-3]|nr:MAG: energy transducer TonB [Gammaproteobacteria bacterium HGW-Gammaproteobacteria-3]
MYLLNNHEEDLGNKVVSLLRVASMPVFRKIRALAESLTGEENPVSIASLLFILVALLHLWAALWLLQPVEPITLAQPLMMEVSLVSLPGKQVTAAPPAPPKPKKPAVKKPVVHKQAKPPKPKAVSDALLPAPSLIESFADASEMSSDAATTANAAKSANGTQGNAEPYSEASFNANYGSNPKPKYPTIARSRGWQGKVLLRVRVTAGGLSEAVSVQRSSGHDVLDESAVAAVEKWKFIPAKRGGIAVASSVIVPIIFTLNP